MVLAASTGLPRTKSYTAVPRRTSEVTVAAQVKRVSGSIILMKWNTRSMNQGGSNPRFSALRTNSVNSPSLGGWLPKLPGTRMPMFASLVWFQGYYLARLYIDCK